MGESDWIAFLSRPEIPRFQAKIADDGDVLSRLVFADWVDEHCPDREFAAALRSSIGPELTGDEFLCPGFPGEEYAAKLSNGQFVIAGGDSVLPNPNVPRSFVRSLWESGWLQTATLRDISSGGLRDWCRLPTPGTLQTLHVSGPELTDDDLFALAKSTHVRGLCALALGGDRIGSRGFHHLLTEGGVSSAINVLSVVSTSVDDAILVGLLGSDRFQCLTHLQLSNNRLGPESCRRFGSLSGLKHLQYLDLSYNQFGNDVSPLASGVRRPLRTVKLGSTGIGDAGVHDFCWNIHAPAWPLLERLELDDNDIGDGGAERVAGWLGMVSRTLRATDFPRSQEWLSTLDLRFNRIGDVGAVSLAAAPGVSNILLDGNPIGQAGAAALAASPHLDAELRSAWAEWSP